jgi:CheY-like chemotaxis protein
LRESETRALQSMHARTEFLANMSHEIRTPLNAIVGMIELLNLEKPTPIQKRYLSTLQNSSDVLLRIINDILDVSKIDEGKLKLEDELFNLREVLNQCLAVYTQASEFKDIFLSGFVDPKVPLLLKGDSTRLQQVIMNLVGNAFKFTEKGHILLRVIPEDSHSIRFSVTDTGTGIEDDAIEHLFERFSQAQTSTTRKFGGTGLGLTIVKQIVELWGGHVFVDSVMGQGSTFSFVLPLQESIRDCTPVSGKYLVCSRHDSLAELWHEDTCAPDMVRVFNESEMLAALQDESFTHLIVEQRFTDKKGSDLIERAKEASPAINSILIGFEKYVQDDSSKQSVDRFQARPYFVNELWDSSFKRASAFKPSMDTQWPDYGHLSVLCVDDNQSNLMVISGLLKRFGIQAQSVSSGTKAIERAAQNNFDLVLMDYEMPDINGPTATREILKLKPMLIIGLSAHTGENFQNEAVESGMQGYLRKPVRIAALDDLLRQHFRSATALPPQHSDHRATL